MYHYPLQYDVLLDLYIVVLNRALIWSKLDIFISAQRAASGDLSRDNYYILEICILLIWNIYECVMEGYIVL